MARFFRKFARNPLETLDSRVEKEAFSAAGGKGGRTHNAKFEP